MKRSVLVLFSCLLLSAAFAVSAGAQTLSTSVTVMPSVSLSLATATNGLAVSSNAITFGNWGAYGSSSSTTVTFVPVGAGTAFSIYTPVNVGVTAANASTYSLTAYATAPSMTGLTGTAPSLLLGVATAGAPSVASTNSASPTSLVASGTSITNGSLTTTTVNVGYQIPVSLKGTGNFTLGGSITFTATAN